MSRVIDSSGRCGGVQTLANKVDPSENAKNGGLKKNTDSSAWASAFSFLEDMDNIVDISKQRSTFFNQYRISITHSMRDGMR